MRFEFKPSFDRSVKSFPGREKEEIKKIAIQAIDVLSQDKIIYKGLGLKRQPSQYPYALPGRYYKDKQAI